MNKNVDIKIYQKSTSIVDVVINRKSNFFNQDFNLVLAKLGNLGYKINSHHTSYDTMHKIINLTTVKNVSQIQRDMNLIFDK